LQHGTASEQSCPYAAQIGVPGGGVVPPVVPVDGPHAPLVEPGGIEHKLPEQQSAVVVHAPPVGTHFVALPAQTRGGVPAGFGTHGSPQQSALDAQALPSKVSGACVQSVSAMRQRGIPRRSCLQVFFCRTLPAQQFAFALHSRVWSRQIAPAGEHALPFVQRPKAAPPSLLHVTLERSPSGNVVDPQQSTSSLHSSPVGLQPLGGWQTKTPVGAYGRQDRLQHSPPHSGSVPPSYRAPPEQVSPAVVQPVAPPPPPTAHRPSEAPAALLQRPPQHSKSLAHASPLCVQNEGAEQKPSLHSFEQHSVFCVQALPEVRQTALSALHAPLSQVPPQHSPFCVHVWPSPVHCLAEHVPLVHEKVQQSTFDVQAEPGPPHVPARKPQTFVVGSHVPEQHSASFAQAAVGGVHAAASAKRPNVPPPSSPDGDSDSLPQPAKASAKAVAVANPTATTRLRDMPNVLRPGSCGIGGPAGERSSRKS